MVIIQEQFKAAPLSSAFMIASILGFIISVLYITKLSVKFGAAFSLVFLLMFLSSFVSMTKAPVGDETFEKDLSIHEHHKHVRHNRIRKDDEKTEEIKGTQQ